MVGCLYCSRDSKSIGTRQQGEEQVTSDSEERLTGSNFFNKIENHNDTKITVMFYIKYWSLNMMVEMILVLAVMVCIGVRGPGWLPGGVEEQ